MAIGVAPLRPTTQRKSPTRPEAVRFSTFGTLARRRPKPCNVTLQTVPSPTGTSCSKSYELTLPFTVVARVKPGSSRNSARVVFDACTMPFASGTR